MRCRAVAGLAMLLVLIGLCLGRNTSATGQAVDWLHAPDIRREDVQQLNPNQELPATYLGRGNIDCDPKLVITRLPNPPANNEGHQNCTVNTGYGEYSSSGYLQRLATSVAGPILKTGQTDADLIYPVPNSHTALRVGPERPIGSEDHSLLFINNYAENLETQVSADGHLKHTARQSSSASLQDRDGHLLYIQPNMLTFSADSHWLVVNSNVGFLRVNLETHEVLPFKLVNGGTTAFVPDMQAAISNDGRWVALSLPGLGHFSIYDLDTCSPVPNTILYPVDCQSRDLRFQLPGTRPDVSTVRNLRFSGDNSLSFYVYYNLNGQAKLARSLFWITSRGFFGMDYLALGDSYTSGEGTFDYRAGTDNSQNKCHLSTVAYPFLIGQSFGFNGYQSVACSGAIINDLTSRRDDYPGQVRDGLQKRDRNLPEILSSFSPGYLSQIEFIEHYNPAIITASAGGNNIGFAAKLLRCLEPDTCFSTYEDRLEIVREANNQFGQLVNMYSRLKTSANANSRLYAIGYPQIAADQGNCAANVHLNHEEIVFAQLLVSYLNNLVEQAAARVGIGYLDIETALNGFRLCEAPNSWEVAVNGLTLGDDIPRQLGGPFGNESYHPNALGHSLVAQKIQAQIDFSQPMPQANLGASPPAESDSLPLLQAARSGRELHKVNYDGDTRNNLMYRNGVWGTVVDGLKFALKKRASYNVVLHSTTINLGNFSTDDSGNLTISATIPNSVEPGLHGLHIYGQNLAGEPLDIYRPVYVADTPGQSPVPDPVLATSADSDKDSVDDGYDGFIARPAASSPGPATPSDDNPPAINSAPNIAGLSVEPTLLARIPNDSSPDKSLRPWFMALMLLAAFSFILLRLIQQRRSRPASKQYGGRDPPR